MSAGARQSANANPESGGWFAARRRPFRKYHVFGYFWRIDWRLMLQLIVIGAPISLSFLLEYGLFGAAGLLMGLISTTALAAHQIALQVVTIVFMVPFGISIAATVRVGHAVGRRDAAAARRAGASSLTERPSGTSLDLLDCRQVGAVSADLLALARVTDT
jgi:Na+-driven multidrug efflux pump